MTSLFNDDIKGLLAELGFNPVETKVFLANLKLGSAPASAIAKEANLNRVTAYEALKRLSKQGMVQIRAKRGGGVRYFQTEDIEVMQEKLESRKKELDQLISKVNFLKSDFRSLYGAAPDKPVVLFYEGREGIKNVLLDTLKQKPHEILSFASADSLEIAYNQEFLATYWKKRTDMRIPSRGIMPATEKAKEFFTPERNRQELRQIKFVAPEVNLGNEIDIYGTTIAIISLSRNNEHGIIIRSASVAEGFRSLFNFFWEELK